MVLARKDFRGAAAKCTASGSVTDSATTITLDGDTSGWPTGAMSRTFNVILDRGVPGKVEKCVASALSGGTLTIDTRGADGTVAVAHDAGCTVEHGIFAGDQDDTNAHIYDESRDDHEQYVRVDGVRPFTNVDSLVDAPVNVGTANAEGTSVLLARADHVHDIANDAVGTAQIAADAVTSSEIATDAVGTAEIAANAVTNSEMADDSVGAAELIDGSIAPVAIADGALGGILTALVTGGPVGGSAAVLATIAIPAQPYAYTLDASAMWSGQNSVDNATFSMAIKVGGVVKGKVVNRHTGGANSDLNYAIPGICDADGSTVTVAATTAVTVTVTAILETGTGNLSESQAGVLVVKLYTKAPAA